MAAKLNMHGRYEESLRRTADLETKLAVAKEALAFYAAKSNWGLAPRSHGSSAWDVLQIDSGSGYDRAAQALAKLEAA